MATNQSDHEIVEQILNLYSDHDLAQIFWNLWNGNQRNPDFITEIGDALSERLSKSFTRRPSRTDQPKQSQSTSPGAMRPGFLMSRRSSNATSTPNVILQTLHTM